MELKNLMGYAVLFTALFVALGIGTNIVRDMQESQWSTTTGVYFDNLTVTSLMNSNVSVGTDDATENCVFTLTNCVVYNSSNGFIIGSGNYTITEPTDCTLYFELGTNVTAGEFYNNTNLNVSCPGYTRVDTNTLYNVTEAGQNATVEFASWGPIVAMVLAAAVIMGVLATLLVRRFL